MSLKNNNIHTSPSRIAWDRIQNIDSLVIVPEPSVEDLNQHGFSLEDLSDAGIGLPDDDLEALGVAAELFKRSETYGEWRVQFVPELTTLWPCKFDRPVQEVSNNMRNAGLRCTLVKGIANDLTEISGFALTPGLKGGDISDHVAAAYLVSGQIPPVPLLKQALKNPEPIMRDELYQAADQLANALREEADLINEKIAVNTYSPRA